MPLPAALARRAHPRPLHSRRQRTHARTNSRDNPTEALQANMLTKDEARRTAINITRLLELLGKAERD